MSARPLEGVRTAARQREGRPVSALVISHAAANRVQGAEGLDEARLCRERRSKKVGALPLRARMVLHASARCVAPDTQVPSDVGVSLGTQFGAIDVAEQALETVAREGFGGVTPSAYATGLPNAVAAIVASVHGLQGPNLTLLGYQSGLDAIIAACRQIRAGNARAMLAGGFDLPSERYAAHLQDTPRYADAGPILPGVGLLWVREADPAEEAAGAVVMGWASGHLATPLSTLGQDTGSDPDVRALIARAVPGEEGTGMRIHALYPGRPGLPDYLAASAPLYLIETVLAAPAPGVHAVLVQGFHPTACLCLVIRKMAGRVAERALPGSEET